MREAEIELDANFICWIFRVSIVRLRIYESKVGPTIMVFKPREVIQRMWTGRCPWDGQAIDTQLDSHLQGAPSQAMFHFLTMGWTPT